MNIITDIAKENGMVKDNKLVGRVALKLKDADGNVVSENHVTNNIVLGIRKPIISLLGGWGSSTDELPVVRQLGLGMGDTAPTVNDEALQREILDSRKLTVTTPVVADDGLSVTFAFLYDSVDSAIDNVDIKEMGLYTADGTMVARTTVGLWRKTTGLYFEVYWTIGYANE